MAYVMEVPVDGGGRLLVQVREDELPGARFSSVRRPDSDRW